MKRLALLLLLLAGPLLRAQEEVLSRVDSLVDNYTAFISRESAEVKKGECDYLIGSLADTVMKARVASRLYGIYSGSRVMGDESVAIYLWDKWLSDKTLPMPSEEDWLDAKMFAEFNRNSLLGMQAPSLKMRRPCMGSRIFPRPGRNAIIFFYDTDCGKCKLESAVLPGVMKDWNVRTDFYAVYVGSDKSKWRTWRREFRLDNPRVRVFHLWDPEVDSDFIRNYGVLSTPKLFLIDSDGRIRGRRLEVENLLQLLPYVQ